MVKQRRFLALHKLWFSLFCEHRRGKGLMGEPWDKLRLGTGLWAERATEALDALPRPERWFVLEQAGNTTEETCELPSSSEILGWSGGTPSEVLFGINPDQDLIWTFAVHPEPDICPPRFVGLSISESGIHPREWPLFEPPQCES